MKTHFPEKFNVLITINFVLVLTNTAIIFVMVTAIVLMELVIVLKDMRGTPVHI